MAYAAAIPDHKWGVGLWIGQWYMKGGLAVQICVLQRLLEDGFQFDGEIVFLGSQSKYAAAQISNNEVGQ